MLALIAHPLGPPVRRAQEVAARLLAR